MRRVMLWIVDHPGPAGLFLLIATLFFGFGLPSLSIDSTTHRFRASDPVSDAFYEQTVATFGADEMTLLLVETPQVFDADVLQRIRTLTETIERLPDVKRVESLTTVRNIAARDDGVDTEVLVPRTIPTDADALARMRADALANPLLVGNLVNPEGTATAVLVFTRTGLGDSSVDSRVTKGIEAAIESVARPGLTMSQIGAPYISSTFVRYLLHDVPLYATLGGLGLFILLRSWFRSWRSALVPLAGSTLCILWTLGAMGWLGIPFTMLSGMMPALLIAIGFTEDTHLIAEYEQQRQEGLERMEAIRAAVRSVATPLLITSASTVVSFATMISASVRVLSEMGATMTVAFLFNFVVTIIVVPLLLRYWPAKWDVASCPGPAWSTRFLQWTGRFAQTQRRRVLVATWLLIGVAALGAASVTVDQDIVADFRKDQPVPQRVAHAHEVLSGALAFSIVVDAGRADGIKDPEVMRGIEALQARVTAGGRTDHTMSVADHVRVLNRSMNGGDEAELSVPGDPDLIAQYLLFLDGKDLASYVNSDYSKARIVVRHNITKSPQMVKLVADIRAWGEELMPKGVKIDVTGETLLINLSGDRMAKDMMNQILQAVAAVALINAMLFYSLYAGILSLVPNLIPVGLVFGLMALLGIPLSAGNSMVAIIAIGVAVDDTVHFMARYSAELNRLHDPGAAIASTLEHEGRAIIVTSLGLSVTMGVLVFSPFLSVASLGGLSAVVFLIALAAELFITPAIMSSTRLVTLWNIVALKMNPDVLREAPLFKGLSNWELRKVILLGELREVPDGEHVLRQGEMGRDMFVVVSGNLDVHRLAADGQRHALGGVGPGDIVGEMAFVDSAERSASAVAKGFSEVLRLDVAALERVRKRFPFTGAKLYRNLAMVLSRRARGHLERH